MKITGDLKKQYEKTNAHLYQEAYIQEQQYKAANPNAQVHFFATEDSYSSQEMSRVDMLILPAKNPINHNDKNIVIMATVKIGKEGRRQREPVNLKKLSEITGKNFAPHVAKVFECTEEVALNAINNNEFDHIPSVPEKDVKEWYTVADKISYISGIECKLYHARNALNNELNSLKNDSPTTIGCQALQKPPESTIELDGGPP